MRRLHNWEWFIKIMKALIIGGAGFLGFYLAKRIVNAGFQVDLLDINKIDTADWPLVELAQNSLVRYISCDFLAVEVDNLDKDYTHIFNFAALLGVQDVLDNPTKVLSLNIALMQKALALAKVQKDINCFVFASTSEVYAGTLEHGSLLFPTPEDTKIVLPNLSSARSTYLLSKIYGEAFCYHSGLPFQIIRPHNIYGPRMGNRHVVPQLMQQALNTKTGTLNVFSVNHTRSFCYVSDAVEMIWRLSRERRADHEIINIGTEDEEITMAGLANIIIDTVGRNLSISPLPATEGSPTRRCPDMKKCLSLTQYKSLVGLKQGVSKCYAWHSKNMFSN